MDYFESNETVYFQFRALAEMIRLILPFWCSFASQNDVCEQEMFHLDLLGRCMGIGGVTTCLYNSTPIPKTLVGSAWQRRHPRRLFWQVHISRGRLKMIKWLLKKSIWTTEARTWHGMSYDDECDGLRTSSSSCNTWLGPHLFFGHFYIIFWSFWEATISSKRHKVKN